MWAQIIATIAGIWLMAAPAVLGYSGAAATNDRIAGPVAATLACIAIWEVTRPLRWINLAIGLWLLIAPWVLGVAWTPTANDMIAGALLCALSPLGKRDATRFGGGWSALRHKPT